MGPSADSELWPLVQAERAALAEDLALVSPEQWHHQSLCGQWDVEQVLAHLTAAASLNQWQWLRSMLGARFRPAVHNQRRLREHQGSTPAETLDKFRAIIKSRIAPSSDTAAYLGEVIVHATDIRHPLGLARTPSMDALTPVAEFYARRDFAVPSRTRAAGLRLSADDGPFTAGSGALVTGPTLALVMALAGRVPFLENLKGPGVPMLRSRLETTVHVPPRQLNDGVAWVELNRSFNVAGRCARRRGSGGFPYHLQSRRRGTLSGHSMPARITMSGGQ